ncbi:hypothetical protein LUZ60_016326 [Juncus effusus]|nr:hypothetical protein LUZ60_016326 [Juncus effusus]
MKSEKPLMLKDYLEVDCNSDPLDTMRHLIEAELRRGNSGGKQLVRTRSKNALSKLSSLIKLDFFLLSCSPSSLHKRSRSSRSFSKKTQNGSSFWKKKAKDQDEKFKVKDIVRLNSFNSPVASSSGSSSSSWSQSDCTGSDFLCSSNGSSEFLPDVAEEEKRSPAGHGGRDEEKVIEEQEKEQLSPVSVMDFPFEEEEEEEEEIEEENETCSSESESSCFERAKEELLQKLRRFECLAELEPMNLNDQFSAVDDESSGHVSSDEDYTEQPSIRTQALELLCQIKTNSINSDCLESLLTDFFTEELNNSNCNKNNKSDYGLKLVEFVRKWVEGESECWEERECRGEMEIGQMEVNGRWRGFEGEKDDVAADLGFRVLEDLLDEVVLDLVLG